MIQYCSGCRTRQLALLPKRMDFFWKKFKLMKHTPPWRAGLMRRAFRRGVVAMHVLVASLLQCHS